jgi:hypothetical protein
MPPLLLVLMLLLALPAKAESGFRASWLVHWGGLEIGALDADARLLDGAYRLSLSAESRGLLAWLVDLQSRVEAEGALDDDGVIPARYRVDSRWNRSERRTRLRFDAAGRMAALAVDPEPGDEREPVPEDLRRAPDPLSAFLRAVRAVMGDPGRAHGFTSYDGARAAAFTVACPVRAEVTHGIELPAEALVCEVTGEQTGGRHRRFGDSRIDAPSRVWLVPAGGIAVPVRAEVPTTLGRVIVRLVAYEPLGR